jgi:hypothetical protein
MKATDLEYYKNKRIKLILFDGSIFTGSIEKLSDDCIVLRDRYNELVSIDPPAIRFVYEQGGH